MHFTLSSAIGNAFKATTSSPTSHTNDHGAKSPIYSRQGWTVFFRLRQTLVIRSRKYALYFL